MQLPDGPVARAEDVAGAGSASQRAAERETDQAAG
jgi:hypothetical protein